MKTQRRVEQGRLVYYRQAATADYWDTHWQTQSWDAMYQFARQGLAGHYALEQVFRRYLPKDAPILEAGCGMGQVVMALQKQGYPIEGIDFAAQTIEQVKQHFPDLPVRVGDITRIDCPANHYGAYISLGVIEHRQAGPEPFLQEAWRVLRPNGIAIITVPHFHPLRQLKARFGAYRGSIDGLEFYQYAYSAATLRDYITQAGFEWVETGYYDSYKGLKDEWHAIKQVIQWPYVGKPLENRLYHSRRLLPLIGHMLVAVCRKVSR